MNDEEQVRDFPHLLGRMQLLNEQNIEYQLQNDPNPLLPWPSHNLSILGVGVIFVYFVCFILFFFELIKVAL